MAVNVGPFQRIVGFHWPAAEKITVEFEFNWWGDQQGASSCSPNTPSPYEGMGEPEIYFDNISPGFFVTNAKLKPDRNLYAAGQTDGVKLINGDYPIGSDFTVSGAPVPTEFSFTSNSTICFNLGYAYDPVAYPFAPLDTRQQRLRPGDDPLTARFSMRSANLTGASWCEGGNLWVGLDSRTINETEDDSFSFEACTETLDFSGLVVTRISDGQMFLSDSLTIEGSNRVTVTLSPA